MCGPIALSLPLNRSSTWTTASGALQYNFGRLLSYCILGIAIGTVGLSVSNVRWMQLLSIIAGLFMVGVAWHRLFKFSSVSQSTLMRQLIGFIGGNIRQLLHSTHWFKFLGLGFLNGFLPCGMVYIGLANALLQGSPFLGGMAMILFGLGTTPALFLVAFFASKLSKQWQLRFSRCVPYLMTIVGIMVIIRGLNLGIPYLSPQIKTVANEHVYEKADKSPVEIICCVPPEE